MLGNQNDVTVSGLGRHYLRLHLTPNVGPVRTRNLVRHFGSVEAVLSASAAELERVERVSTKVARAVFEGRGDDRVDREIERSAAAGIQILCIEDPAYPRPLLQMADPPTCLFVRGRLEPTDAVAIAVVGTRRCSLYGREQALRFGEMLGAAGFTVVSGLARGVDAHTHTGALRSGGRTIAVLGNGLSTIYPPEHEDLASDIAGSGAVVTENAFDIAPDAKNFPRRNRIIAGLSLGVLVIEAGKRSGALITARLASEYNREVFALPGRVDCPDETAGVHALIRDGHAKLVTCLEDILDELVDLGQVMGKAAGHHPKSQSHAAADAPVLVPELPSHEQAIFNAVAGGAGDADAIGAETGLDVARITSTLTALQLKGLVRCLPGSRFVPRRG